ncbi:hypothetical protein [Aridibaculum aurantiacum]|uniref:hypothetical protein n=1 Tax=Aridibaculum aurantiacum TaxID=2810307 RepID=UPI001A96D58B|nr:hypothetical protein [Aridibaculum aurantiacum]
MFLSTDFLTVHYGVDARIAKYFVDRDPPAGNLYWKDKLLYLRFEPGYIFIPLIVDILFKNGFDRDQLLSSEFINLMEGIGHVSALEETNRITEAEAIAACYDLAVPVCKNEQFLQDVTRLLKGEESKYTSFKTGFNALHRGDLFLYSIAALSADEAAYDTAVKYWFALISSLLLLDDAEDVPADLKSGDANAFIESGMDEDGIARIKQLVKDNLQLISTTNKAMALRLDKQLVDMLKKPHFQHLLNLQ